MSSAGCMAQDYWYDNGVQRATFCPKPATVETRSLDGSRTNACTGHAARMIDAGATKVRDLNPEGPTDAQA